MPIFPYLDMSTDIQVEGETVYFDLTYGCNVLNCQIKAETTYDTREVTDQSSGCARDQEYEVLVVDTKTHAVVTDKDGIESPIGLRFKLTDAQVSSLNEQLKYYAEELADEEAECVMGTKYDWSTIPVEANWAATDENGLTCCYTTKPFMWGNEWLVKNLMKLFFVIDLSLKKTGKTHSNNDQ